MKPTEEQIKEMAELLGCGQICYFHSPSGRIEHHADPDNEYFDPGAWQGNIDRIEADWENYQRFEKMDSRQSFRVMEDFAETVTEIGFRSRLLGLLSGPRPFSKFKRAIDSSRYRQDWFAFKERAYINWVHQQIEGQFG